MAKINEEEQEEGEGEGEGEGGGRERERERRGIRPTCLDPFVWSGGRKNSPRKR